MTLYFDLSGKVALVTGASSGIGAATAQVLAELGANVAIGFFNNADGAAYTKQQVEKAGRKAAVIHADMRETPEVQKLVSQTRDQLGPIDILINNAGSLIQRQPLMTMPEERWDEVINLNLKSVLLCTQAVAPSMVERKAGSIVNIVSIAGRNGGGTGSGHTQPPKVVSSP